MPTPSPEPPRPRLFNHGLLISLVFHVVVIGLLAWFAAREGILGEPLKQITVRLLPPPVPEKPPAPAKPKPEPPPEKPGPLPEPAPAKIPAQAPTKTPMPATAPGPAATPLLAAPPPAEMPPLTFDDGGKTVQSETDPDALYRSFVEFSLRSRWNRPTDMADAKYMAEIEIAVDAAGRVSAPRWKRKSGNARWDASVMDAITETRSLDRPPPAGFPARLTVRFDVIQTTAPDLP
jgi:hypothetical protein